MHRAKTLGELKKSGYVYRSVKDEMRENLFQALRERRKIFQGIVGYDETVIPQVINAILSRHNVLLLGERGQAKTRLIRSFITLLDEQIPIIEGTAIPEDPLHPITKEAKNLIDKYGDELPIIWLSREDRYREKLATPDVTVADLIGDIDPIKAMNQKLQLADESVINYGLIPKSNRCLFAINELPDLQPRIQISLFNIMEERDIQIRNFPVRLNLDISITFTANPEDYTSRGRIITPLKDRIESQIITHYPKTIDDGVAIVKQEAWLERGREVIIPALYYELIEGVAACARASKDIDQNSGVSSRLSINLLEIVISSIEQRNALLQEEAPCARMNDLFAGIPAVSGKVEIINKESEITRTIGEHLISLSIQNKFKSVFEIKNGSKKGFSQEIQSLVDWFESNNSIQISDQEEQNQVYNKLNKVPALAKLGKKLLSKNDSPVCLTSMMQFIIEGMAQNLLITKVRSSAGVSYVDELSAMEFKK